MAVSSGAWRSTSRSAANRSTTSQSSSRRSRSRATAGRDDHRARRPRRHFRARPRARGPRSRGRPRVDRRVRSVFARRDERAREDRRLERSSPDRSRSGVPVGALPRRAGRSRRDRDPAGSRRDERRIRAHVRIPLCRVCCRPLEGQSRAGVSRTARADALRRAGDRDRRVPRDRARPIGADRDVTSTEISYGKAHVVFYRLGGRDIAPLAASVAVDGMDGKSEITAARSGWEGMVLVKTTGSSFATFARDDYTTLPDLADRPLTIRMDVYWRYTDLADGVAEGPGFLGPRAVRDEIERIFHEFNSRSIQHLVHEIGARLFAAHPQLGEIEFVAQNHTPDHVRDDAGGVRVLAEAKPTFGKLGLVLRR